MGWTESQNVGKVLVIFQGFRHIFTLCIQSTHFWIILIKKLLYVNIDSPVERLLSAEMIHINWQKDKMQASNLIKW